jgi:uroporphyrinogen decarboxylase
MAQMTKRERVGAAVRGEATDRPAWSLWRHFYAAESTAVQLAERMLGWIQSYGFDFLKVNPRAQYHVEPWGATYRYSGREHERPERLDYPIRQPEDWLRLEPRGLDSPALNEQLSALRLIAAGLNGETPFVETIFSPLGVAGNLVETERTLVRHIREQPEAVHHGLSVIAETFAPFATACLEAGADGIFFATTRWASRDYLTPEEYAQFGRPYDLRVLEAAREGSFNILHVCDGHNMLLDLADYPVAAFNWAVTDRTNPTLTDAAELPGLRIGGLSDEALLSDDPKLAAEEARKALAETGGKRWALGANCSSKTQTRDASIRAAGRAIGVHG